MKKQFQLCSGLTYLEVLIATVLILITLVPALESLYGGIQGSNLHTNTSINQQRLTGKMEQTLARPYSDLLIEADLVADPATLIPAPYSDAAGTESRRLVYLAHYDGDNADADDDPFSGTDSGLLWVKVIIDGSTQSLETLIHE